MLRTIGSSIARKIRETGGAILGIGAVADGEYLKRSGSSIVGDSPAGSGDMTKATYDSNDDGKVDEADSADRLATYTLIVPVTAPDEAVAVGDGAAYIPIPAALNTLALTGISSRLVTPGTTGTMDIQLHNVTDSVDVLSTKLTTDSGEAGSDTAVTAAVINEANDDTATYDMWRIDIDAIHTTPGKGLTVTLEFS